MNLFERIRFALDDVGTVGQAIKRWRPRLCNSEKDYERSLYDYLHRAFPDLQITKQYAKGRVRADIAVEDRVIIEIKHNLDSTAKYQRLLGQLADYKDWNGSCILLITGDSDKNLLKELDRYLRREDLHADEDGPITVMQK